MTVFVGKIPPNVPDHFIYALLEQCGRVLEWKPVEGKNFGFCLYARPVQAQRAVTLLNGFKVDYQEIVAKVGKKEVEILAMLPVSEYDKTHDEVARQRLSEIIQRRNFGARAPEEGKDGGEGGGSSTSTARIDHSSRSAPTSMVQRMSMAVGPPPPVEEVRAGRAQDTMVISEVERFRMQQADRDRRKEEDRLRDLRRRVEEQERQERRRKEREAREAAEREKEEAGRSASGDRGGKRSRGDEENERDDSSKRAVPDADSLVQAALTASSSSGALQEGSRGNLSIDLSSKSRTTASTKAKDPSTAASSSSSTSSSSTSIAGNSRVISAFHSGEEEEGAGKMARPLVPLDYDDDQEGGSKKKQQAASTARAPGTMTERQKRLISEIPQDKEGLFRYQVDWAVLDAQQLVPGKLRAWVVKKIRELLGEEEATLIDYICSKLSSHCRPQDLLAELKLVLEDDADLFTQKLWRIMIYYTIESRVE